MSVSYVFFSDNPRFDLKQTTVNPLSYLSFVMFNLLCLLQILIFFSSLLITSLNLIKFDAGEITKLIKLIAYVSMDTDNISQLLGKK